MSNELTKFTPIKRRPRIKHRNSKQNDRLLEPLANSNPRGGGTLEISGWGCAAGTLEPLTYTRASSAEFCHPILE